MSNLNQRKDQFMSQVDDLFGFNLTNRQDTISYDFGQYKLNKLYKPLVKYFIDQFHKHLEAFDAIQAEKILWLFLDFYSLYYSNGDFGYFKNRFSTYQYRIPYSGKDTEFWRATKDCYYVKTSDVVNDMAVSLWGMFDGRDAKLKFFKKTQADTDNDGNDVFSFGIEVEEMNDEESEEITGYHITFINWEESKEKRTTKEKIIYEKLQEYNIDTKSEPIKSTLDSFLKKRGRDYFIHKRLKAFLTEELERYFFQMLKGDLQGKSDIISIQSKIEEIKAKYSDDPEVVDFKIGQLMKESKPDIQLSVYETAYLWILNFANIIGDLEEFKAKLWNKKRKVIKQEYCISIGKIKELENLIPRRKEILKAISENIDQIKEWESMGMKTDWDYIEDDSLVVDTKNFSGKTKEDIINISQSNEIIGELYHSDNYQALRFMQDEYRGKVKCIYIDPPYNTGKDGFVYKDSYQSASWLSMMQDRLLEAKQLMSEDGVIFTSIDSNEITNLENLQKWVFWEDNYVCDFIWEKHKAPKSDNKYITINHEHIVTFWKDKNKFNRNLLPKSEEFIKKNYKNPDYDSRWLRASWPLLAPTFSELTVYWFEWPNWNMLFPPKWKCWSFNQKKMQELIEDNRIWFWVDGNNVPRYKRFVSEMQDWIVPLSMLYHDDVWWNQRATTILTNLFWGKIFTYPKSVDLIVKLFLIWSQKNDIVVDFFAWSWTTWHAVMKLNKEDWWKRKFILVELGQYFDTVTLPRIKKVMYSDNRKDGQAIDNDGTLGIISYKQLNQYEDRFNEWWYLSRIDSQIKKLEQTDISKINDIKNILYPLKALKEKIFGLDE